jgi:hypothetical protein
LRGWLRVVFGVMRGMFGGAAGGDERGGRDGQRLPDHHGLQVLIVFG